MRDFQVAREIDRTICHLTFQEHSLIAVALASTTLPRALRFVQETFCYSQCSCGLGRTNRHPDFGLCRETQTV